MRARPPRSVGARVPGGPSRALGALASTLDAPLLGALETRASRIFSGRSAKLLRGAPAAAALVGGAYLVNQLLVQQGWTIWPDGTQLEWPSNIGPWVLEFEYGTHPASPPDVAFSGVVNNFFTTSFEPHPDFYSNPGRTTQSAAQAIIDGLNQDDPQGRNINNMRFGLKLATGSQPWRVPSVVQYGRTVTEDDPDITPYPGAALPLPEAWEGGTLGQGAVPGRRVSGFRHSSPLPAAPFGWEFLPNGRIRPLSHVEAASVPAFGTEGKIPAATVVAALLSEYSELRDLIEVFADASDFRYVKGAGHPTYQQIEYLFFQGGLSTVDVEKLVGGLLYNEVEDMVVGGLLGYVETTLRRAGLTHSQGFSNFNNWLQHWEQWAELF